MLSCTPVPARVVKVEWIAAQGAQSADSSGRAQKTVCLPGGGCAKVRCCSRACEQGLGELAGPQNGVVVFI